MNPAMRMQWKPARQVVELASPEPASAAETSSREAGKE
jgi:hypothetical protein